MNDLIEIVSRNSTIVNDIAALHIECLPSSKVTKLGPRYCERFYTMLVHSSTDHVLVANDDGLVKGAAALIENPRLLPLRMLITTPLLLALGKNLISGGGMGSDKHPISQTNAIDRKTSKTEITLKKRIGALPELTNIFVAPQWRGAKLGRKLVEACAQLCRDRGFSEFFVKTDAAPDNQAIYFYQALKAQNVGIIERNGRQFIGFVVKAE